MRKESNILESDIDEEIILYIMNSENIQSRKICISILVDAIQISNKEKKEICKHLNKKWIYYLKNEGIISDSRCYHFVIKKYSEKKHLVLLKRSYLSEIIKRFFI